MRLLPSRQRRADTIDAPAAGLTRRPNLGDNITMDRSLIAVTADEALRRLGPLCSIVYRCLEMGAERARHFFDDPGQPFNPFVFSSLVRYYTLQELTSDRYDEAGFQIAELPNVGIRIECSGFLIRIWKTGEEGELPPPGESPSRQGFYNQEQPYLPFDYLDLEQFARVKLALVWNAGPDMTLSELYLVCPSGEDGPWRAGTHHWNRKIEHPAKAVEAEVLVHGNIEDADLDLDLALERTGEDLSD